MTAKGHVLLALPLAILGASHLGFTHLKAGLFIAVVCIGVLAPDIDEGGSFIGRQLWFLSFIVKILSFFLPAFKHRGITHIFLIPISMIIFASVIHNVWIAGFALGWLLHTAGDMLTVGGIKGYLYPLWPNEKIVLLPDVFRFYTGGFAEQVLIGFLMILDGWMLISTKGIFI